jgi:hypothetical protein
MEKKRMRSNLVSNCNISLTKTDPLERLKELCEQGHYEHKLNWDKFKNGFMCECSIYYYTSKRSSRILAKESYWVQTDDLTKAQKTISAILLQSIGLGVPEEEVEESVEDELLRVGTRALNGFVSQFTESSKTWADIVDEEEQSH